MNMEEICELELVRGGDTVIDIKTTMKETTDPSERMVLKEPLQIEEPGNQIKEKTPKQEGGHSSQGRLQILLEQELEAIRQNRSENQPFSIFRVPDHVREKAKTLYEPQWVSIGPYYHGKERLRTMEEHKRRCLSDFLDRNTEIGLEVYLKEMRKLENRARQCYSESVKMDSDQFVLMLLLDGCFILEFCLKSMGNVPDALLDTREYAIRTDFVLLENQIPFFVIHKLAFLLSDPTNRPNCKDECPILNLIIPCFPLVKFMRWPSEISCDEVDHSLHIYYKCIVPKIDIKQINSERTQPHSMKTRCLSWIWSWIPSKSRGDSSDGIFPCAIVLHESGVTFRRKRNPHDMFDITFHDGVMEIPCLSIEENTKIIFANVTAFEQTQYNTKTFTSFAALMDFLINTENDVALLTRSGIIENLLESDEDAAAFFNQLCVGTTMSYKSHYLASLFREVHKYSSSTWPKYRARLIHDYFSNPWTSISVFAGVLLLGLTVTQTYFTIYSAYHH